MSLTVGWMAFSNGHWIANTSIGRRYVDPDKFEIAELVPSDPQLQRPCTECGAPRTPAGHDACIPDLPGVTAACCGHGSSEHAYVQTADGSLIKGRDAISWIIDRQASDA